MSILPQAVAALVITVLLSIGALFIGTNGTREIEKFHPAAACTTGSTPVQCVGN